MNQVTDFQLAADGINFEATALMQETPIRQTHNDNDNDGFLTASHKAAYHVRQI
jgi:hypothetical protein